MRPERVAITRAITLTARMVIPRTAIVVVLIGSEPPFRGTAKRAEVTEPSSRSGLGSEALELRGHLAVMNSNVGDAWPREELPPRDPVQVFDVRPHGFVNVAPLPGPIRLQVDRLVEPLLRRGVEPRERFRSDRGQVIGDPLTVHSPRHVVGSLPGGTCAKESFRMATLSPFRAFDELWLVAQDAVHRPINRSRRVPHGESDEVGAFEGTRRPLVVGDFAREFLEAVDRPVQLKP